MPQDVAISPEAMTLLRRRMGREYVPVTEDNRPFFRELVAAGLMEPISTFLHGREGTYRPLEAAIAFLSQSNPEIQPAEPEEALSRQADREPGVRGDP